MIKIFLPLIIVFGLISCKNSTELAGYFGQTCPDSIPMIFASGTISIEGRLETGLSFSPDGKELSFGVYINQNDNIKGILYYSKRKNNTWSEIVEPDFIGEGSFYAPCFTPDGKSLIFAKSNPDSLNYDYYDIWIVSKQDEIYNNPKRLNEPVSSFTRDANASITFDGTIYVASTRDHHISNTKSDIYSSKKINGEYTQCNKVEIVSSENDEESIFISPNDNYLITCRYTNDTTWIDLYISYRNIDNKWIEPRIIDSTINSTDWDRRPFVTIDNKYLFFTRLQIGEKGLTESDIYWVNTSKLFKPFVYNAISDTTVQVGEKFEISIPADYFKDIDDNHLELSINRNEFDWIKFDSENKKLSGLPTVEGEYELTFTAIDKHLNKTEDKIKIKVTE
jgi:hypothetical protein